MTKANFDTKVSRQGRENCKWPRESSMATVSTAVRAMGSDNFKIKRKT